MYPVLYHNAPFTIYSLGGLWVLAAVCAGYVVRLELKRYRFDPELASSMVFTAAAGGLVGARLLFIPIWVMLPLDAGILTLPFGIMRRRCVRTLPTRTLFGTKGLPFGPGETMREPSKRGRLLQDFSHLIHPMWSKLKSG